MFMLVLLALFCIFLLESVQNIRSLRSQNESFLKPSTIFRYLSTCLHVAKKKMIKLVGQCFFFLTSFIDLVFSLVAILSTGLNIRIGYLKMITFFCQKWLFVIFRFSVILVSLVVIVSLFIISYFLFHLAIVYIITFLCYPSFYPLLPSIF